MTRGLYVAVILLCMTCAGCGSRDSAQPAPVDPALAALLEYYDEHYDSEQQMLCLEFDNPGYHSKVASGTKSHPTRESLTYALGLLQRDAPGNAQRAAEVIRHVLPLQDTDPASPTYGIWPWLKEELLTEMAAPDFNWADFCGAQLAQMLIEHSGQLPDDLQAAMRQSLGHAVNAIRKRDVKPGYTNIAILGGGVCAAAGELLGDPELLDYGRRRLESVVEFTASHGSFAEYNSPAYTRAALAECERTLQLVRDPAVRAAAESLRRTAWEIIAGSFHAGTQQWAGPHSRVYADHLRVEVGGFIARRTGVPIQPHPAIIASGEPSDYAVIRSRPCPDDLLPRFLPSPVEPHQLRRTFVRGKSDASSKIGTTWFALDACLGSVNQSILWTQRRPLIAYWRTQHDPAVVFRLRFLHDGKDFASMGVRTSQEGSRALSVFHSVPNRGDWHPSLDRPDDGIFQASDFRVRYELRGTGVTAESIGRGRYVLAAGERRIVIHAPEARFAGQNVVWQLQQDDERVWLDGICYQGKPTGFDFRAGVNMTLAAGIELLDSDAPNTPHLPDVTELESGAVSAEWSVAEGEKLSVTAPGS